MTHKMYLNLRFKLIQENDVAAVIDQQALIGGNNVGVTEISGDFWCPSCPAVRYFFGKGARVPASSIAPAHMDLSDNYILQLRIK